MDKDEMIFERAKLLGHANCIIEALLEGKHDLKYIKMSAQDWHNSMEELYKKEKEARDD